MTITVTPRDDFDLELYSYQTDVRESRLRELLSELAGFDRSWTVLVHEPSKHDPNGRLTICHSGFNEYTSIEITSRDRGDGITYAVHHPMETDILTEVEDVSLPEAIRVGVETANRERQRQTSVLTRAVTPFADALNRARP